MVNLNPTKSFRFDLKCTKIAGGWGSAPDPLGELVALPNPSSCQRGQRGEKGMGGKIRGGRGGEAGEDKGGDFCPSTPTSWLRHCLGSATSFLYRIMFFSQILTSHFFQPSDASDHNLIRSVMEYHHLPSIFRDLFDAIYTDSHIKIAVNKDWTSNLGVNKGVLQGDPCSPLLFNLCFNTLMRILREKKLEKLGYIWGPDGNSNECSWLQFADDAVVVSGSVRDSQSLIDIFAAWCAWAGMDVRLDKCCTYAAAKHNGVYTQFEPLLLINSQPVPVVSINESFTYLGEIFDFEMRNDRAKRALTEKLSRLLEITSSLKIKAQLKLKILKIYILSQITHELKMYAFGETWIIQNLDSACANHIRGWLGMPVSSCVKEFSSLPMNKGGLGIPSFADQYRKLILAKRAALKNSSQPEILQIWSDTTEHNIVTDTRLFEDIETSEAQRKLKNDLNTKAEVHIRSLVCQGELARCVSENIPRAAVEQWSRRLESLPDYLFRFVRKAFQQQLPTASNLKRWKRIDDPNCPLCHKTALQTNKHVLSNCSAALNRYLERHNKILLIIANWKLTHKRVDQRLLVDLPSADFESIDVAFQSSTRPGIVICEESKILVLELTVCHETNLQKSKQFKLNKYENINTCLQSSFKNIPVQVYSMEVSVLGFISELKTFTNAAVLPDMNTSTRSALTLEAIKNSYEIYKQRNSATALETNPTPGEC